MDRPLPDVRRARQGRRHVRQLTTTRRGPSFGSMTLVATRRDVPSSVTAVALPRFWTRTSRIAGDGPVKLTPAAPAAVVRQDLPSVPLALLPGRSERLSPRPAPVSRLLPQPSERSAPLHAIGLDVDHVARAAHARPHRLIERETHARDDGAVERAAFSTWTDANG